MNPLTNTRNIKALNENDIKNGIFDHRNTWHSQYKDSAYIFIGGLPYELTEGDVLCVFSQYGEIVSVNLVRDKKTGKTKGYGFLCYEDQRSAILAVDNLNSIKLGGRTIRVDHVSNYRAPLSDEKDESGKFKVKEEKDMRPKTPPPENVESKTKVKKEKKKKKKRDDNEKKRKKKKDKREASASSDSEDTSSDSDRGAVDNRLDKKEKRESLWDKREVGPSTSREKDYRGTKSDNWDKGRTKEKEKTKFESQFDRSRRDYSPLEDKNGNNYRDRSESPSPIRSKSPEPPHVKKNELTNKKTNDREKLKKSSKGLGKLSFKKLK